ncbi:flavin-containing monooxygenase [Corynebacterium halotolerans]|uniref:FAD-dependent pyridine nucleotide-disulfide oxidoreductase n=1 Tax=Corynebacterium halotolerans YIM 70093 = DSM 44683 TaxID=1121362 RepID=M1NNP8_9CORY|nr:NAD(P)/FAD-dependent oxidoreductase [Corynebacterium halotolerans]AGF72963.1 FAD-dependent pyridine nucleotide-disulfide oxidoreductase [Corynebacterium halotolerans YIM 70093 = DSM 44683]
MDTTDTTDTVIVIGAGPAGLSTAAELLARDVPTTVLERGSELAATWAARYKGLRFNTSRRSSALPGAPFPREYGQFPTREQYLTYLQRYAADHRIPVETGVEVTGVRRIREGWALTTSAGERRARHVVIATGLFNRPRIPGWAREPGFDGEVLHSSAYRDAADFAGRSVVVVGAGSSGMEIAHQLATGGARAVRLAVRTPPNILLRELNGLPGDLPAPLLFHLPTALADRLVFAVQRRIVGDLSGYGLPRPTRGMMSRQKENGAGPAVVDREVIDAIRGGAIECVPAVTALDGDTVVLADGRHVTADAVILATGYDTGLPDLVAGLDVLDERGLPLDCTGGEVAPGLRFVGYVYRPGLTGYVGKIARRVAREIATRSAKEARRSRHTAAA